jgi:hypothetical protein
MSNCSPLHPNAVVAGHALYEALMTKASQKQGNFQEYILEPEACSCHRILSVIRNCDCLILKVSEFSMCDWIHA